MKEVSFTECYDRAEAITRLYFPQVNDLAPYKEHIATLIEHEDLQWIFTVPDGIVYTEKELISSSGQLKRIDRLIVKEKEIYVIDYKSVPMETADESVSSVYEDQVREYMKIVHNIYPKRAIKGYLLYMDTCMLQKVNP